MDKSKKKISSIRDLVINILIDHDNVNYCLSKIRSHFDGYIEGKQRKKEIAANLHQLHTHLPTKR
jgi:hypothetical protein